MRMITDSFETVNRRRDRVDFRAVSDAALMSLEVIAAHYLPRGYRKGREWVSINPTRADAKPGSFKFNLSKGIWSDFATGDTGDSIDLVAYLTGQPKIDAARELQRLLNVPSGSTSLTGNVRPISVKPAAPTAMSPVDAFTASVAFLPRTIPDKDGKPLFIKAREEGPRIRDGEKRRHVYRQGSVPMRIKIVVSDGDVFNVYRVVDVDGTSGWQYAKPDGFQAMPYASVSTFDGDGPIYWPEGEKDVDTLTKVGLPAFTFGGTGDGLPDGCADYVTGKAVVILADNDEPGRKHADAKAVVIHGIAASVRIIHFQDVAEKGDVSDWIAAGNSADDLAKRADADCEWSPFVEATTVPSDDTDDFEQIPPPTPSKDKRFELPFGYRFRSDGLYWSDPNDDDKPDIKLSGAFDVLAETRDGDSSNWGVLMHWVDHDNREHRFALPRAMLAGDGSDARKALLMDGLYIAPSQKARGLLNSFLLQVRSPVRARATQRIGWHGNAFVLPDDAFGGADDDKLLLQTSTANEHCFRQAGTLQSWQQNVARYAVGNSRLVIALSAAFAGPLIGPCAAEGGGLHFRGASSTGKCTALHVAGSAWGGGSVTGFVRSWRATANGLEGVAQGHCDTLLCLDELSQLQARDAGEAAYMLANGSGKSRSARDGSARRAASWRVMFLSSGEIGLSDKIAEDGRGKKTAAGQQVRIIDIAADAGAGMGMFNHSHGFDSAEALARHLREATQQHYGVAAREYLKLIVPAMVELQQQVSAIMAAFCATHLPPGSDGQVMRVAQRLALIAAGGEIAVRAGILPWPEGEALDAAGSIFNGWLVARGGHAPAEERAGIEQVRAFLLANGMARFIPAWDEDADKRILIRDVAGYRQKTGDGWDYFVTPPAWKEICAGLDPRRTAGVLAMKGFIAGGDGAHLAKSIRPPGMGKQRAYHVLSGLLDGDEDA
jgi:putative DNA primase/helicase